jgi:hypothetical protein
LAVLALVVCASLIGLRKFYRQPGQEDWKGAISYLAQNARTGDGLIFANPYCRFPFDYNLRMSGTRLPPMRLDPGGAGAARDFALQAQHLWVLCGSESLPKGSVSPEEMPGFYLKRTQRFQGANIQELDRVPSPIDSAKAP